MMYCEARDAYLKHVEHCATCSRYWVDFWDHGVHVTYWSIYKECPERAQLMQKIDDSLFKNLQA
jgi:hypothetical protein